MDASRSARSFPDSCCTRLVPTLIEQGYVYIGESLLYEITYRDNIYNHETKSGYPQKLEAKILSMYAQVSKRTSLK